MALIHEELTHRIIGACMEVHRHLGPGLNEVVYKDGLAVELQLLRIPYSRERRYDVVNKGVVLPHYFVADFVVDDMVVLEAKAVDALSPAHIAQTLNYLAIAKLKVALLVNFGGASLKWKRIVL